MTKNKYLTMKDIRERISFFAFASVLWILDFFFWKNSNNLSYTEASFWDINLFVTRLIVFLLSTLLTFFALSLTILAFADESPPKCLRWLDF